MVSLLLEWRSPIWITTLRRSVILPSHTGYSVYTFVGRFRDNEDLSELLEVGQGFFFNTVHGELRDEYSNRVTIWDWIVVLLCKFCDGFMRHKCGDCRWYVRAFPSELHNHVHYQTACGTNRRVLQWLVFSPSHEFCGIACTLWNTARGYLAEAIVAMSTWQVAVKANLWGSTVIERV